MHVICSIVNCVTMWMNKMWVSLCSKALGQDLTIGVVPLFQVFYGQLPSCYECSRGHPKELRKETYTVSPLFARKLCTEWVSSLWATLILGLLVCISAELSYRTVKITKFNGAMFIISLLQEQSHFVFKVNI